jgi:hypothetical protein
MPFLWRDRNVHTSAPPEAMTRKLAEYPFTFRPARVPADKQQSPLSGRSPTALYCRDRSAGNVRRIGLGGFGAVEGWARPPGGCRLATGGQRRPMPIWYGGRPEMKGAMVTAARRSKASHDCSGTVVRHHRFARPGCGSRRLPATRARRTAANPDAAVEASRCRSVLSDRRHSPACRAGWQRRGGGDRRARRR